MASVHEAEAARRRPGTGGSTRTITAPPRPIVKATDLGSVHVLKHQDRFILADPFGDIRPDARGLGLYDGDTRILSCATLHIGGERPIVLRSDAGDAWRGRILATNPELRRNPGDKIEAMAIERRTFSIERDRSIGRAFEERIRVTNHGSDDERIRIDLGLGADMADIFEVRGYERSERGRLEPIRVGDGQLVFGYAGLDGVRVRTHVELEPTPVVAPAADDADETVVASWTCDLAPGAASEVTWRVWADRSGPSGDDDPGADGVAARRSAKARPGARRPDPWSADPAAAHAAWRSAGATVETDNEIVDLTINRGLDDLCLLLDTMPDGDRYVAAGVPWFSSLFGRDAILAAYESIAFRPGLAAHVLRTLARRQATEDDPAADAEPGKILHEARTGEMSRTGELPFRTYYGSADATPLWLILLGEYHDWTADDDLVDELWPNALAALEWLERWGDPDGDGFVEYQRRAPLGLRNQGWKDSADSIRDRTGAVAEPPIALAEVQGYAYDARRRLAHLARHRGDWSLAHRLEADAAALAERFGERFWVADRRFLAMALDGGKRAMDAIASNAGHCLWSGIVADDQVEAVSARLLTPELFSGWGLRTYAEGEPGYNPISYHTGSVWPHDTAIAAAGLKAVGADAMALRLADGLFGAAQHFPDFRLPELLCGFDGADGPVPYPVACSPQAWSAAAPLSLVRTLIGLHADASTRSLELTRPQLPGGVDKLVIHDLRVGPAHCDLLVHRWRGRPTAEVLDKDEDLSVTIRL